MTGDAPLGTIGGYAVEQEIGRGASGVVYRARARDGRPVAVKLIRPLKGDALARFERESRLASSLAEDAGFVPVIDKGTHGGSFFLVAPLMEGGTLRERLRAGPMKLADAVAVGRALARALGMAHARGVVHRDVKPENVLFDRAGGRPLLTDLGLAKHFDRALGGASRSVALTGEGAIKGTMGYMPLEQMRDARAVGPPADVFALGCVIYECLCGDPPFVADTFVGLINVVDRGVFAPIRSRRADVPGALAACIERALLPDPRERFPDGGAFERALLSAAKDEGRRARRLRAALAVVGGVAVLSGLGVAVARVVGSSGDTRVAPGGKGGPGSKTTAVSTPRGPVDRAYECYLKGDRLGALDEANRALATTPGLADALAIRSLVTGDAFDDAGALAIAREALARDATSILALSAVAIATRAREEASACAEKAVALDARSPVAHVARARAVSSSGDSEGALVELSRAIELAPSYAAALRFRAECHAHRKEPGWRADVERVASLAPRDACSLAFCGQVASLARDAGLALKLAESALELEPKLLRALSCRGLARVQLGESVGATEDATRLIAQAPDLAFGWALRALARSLLEDERGASDAARALKLPHDVLDEGLAWHALGLVRSRWGDERGAYAAFQESSRRDPSGEAGAVARAWLAAHPLAKDAPPPLDRREASEALSLGRMALDKGDLAETIRCATRVIQSAPETPNGWELRATAVFSSKRYEEAARDASQALDLDPMVSMARAVRIGAYLKTGDLTAAAADADAFVSLRPLDGAAWRNRCMVRREQKDFAGAAADAAEVVRLAPTDAIGYYALGIALDAAGDVPGARATFERFVELDPRGQSGADVSAYVRRWLSVHPAR